MSRLGRNTALLVAFAVGDGVLGWVQLKWLALHLGAAGIGLFAILFSLGSVLLLALNAGLVLLLTRYTASLEGEGRPGLVSRLALGCLAYSVLAGGLASALAFVYSPALCAAWAPLRDASRSLPWVALFFASNSVRYFLYAVWNGRRQMQWPGLVDMLQLGAVTVRMFLPPHLTLEDFFLWNAATSLLATVACCAIMVPGMVRGAGGRFSGEEARELRQYGGWSALLSATSVGFDYLDRLFLAARISAAGVSYFHVPARWLQFVRRLMSQPLTALFPELARGTPEGRGGAFAAFIETYSAVGLAVGVVLALSPGAFIRLLASSEFDAGIPILRVLALVPPLMGLYAPFTTALRARGSMAQGAISDILWVAVYLGLGVSLMARLGSMALAASQVAASGACLGWNLYACRRESWGRLPWNSIGRQWAAAALAMAAGLLAPGGATGWWAGFTGLSAFLLLLKVFNGISRDARRQVSARLPGPLRMPFARIFGD